MRLLQNFKFFENSAAPQTSNVLVNSYNGSELTLQVSTGTATSLTIKVFTKADQQNGEFVETQVIGLAPEMDLFDEITKKGIYSVGVTGIREIKLELVSSNGDVSVFGTISE